jgi:hypothetical protein
MTDPSSHLLRPYIWNCVIQQIISRVPGIDGSRKVKWHQTRKAHPMSLLTSATTSSNDSYKQLTSRHIAFPTQRGKIHLAAVSLSLNTTQLPTVRTEVYTVLGSRQMSVGDCRPSISWQKAGYELACTSNPRIKHQARLRLTISHWFYAASGSRMIEGVCDFPRSSR